MVVEQVEQSQRCDEVDGPLDWLHEDLVGEAVFEVDPALQVEAEEHRGVHRVEDVQGPYEVDQGYCEAVAFGEACELGLLVDEVAVAEAELHVHVAVN